MFSMQWISAGARATAAVALAMLACAVPTKRASAGYGPVFVGSPQDRPYRQQCLIVSYWRNADGLEVARTTGSGTVIGPRQVLTAAHVVQDSLYGGTAARVEIIPGFSGGYRPFGTFYSTRISPYPGYKSVNLTQSRDIAVVTTSQEIGTVLGGWFNCNGFSATQQAWMSGYPGSLLNNGVNWWKLRQVFSMGQVSVDLGLETWSVTVGMTADHGLSGAGIINANNEVIGVLTRLNRGTSRGIRINPNLDWINGIIRADGRTSSRAFTEGKLVREAARGEVFQIVGGAKLHVTSAEEFMALGYSWDWIEVVENGSTDAIPVIPDDGTVIRERSNGRVYLVEGSKKHWIPNEKVLNRYGGWDAVKVISNGSSAHIPFGYDLY